MDCLNQPKRVALDSIIDVKHPDIIGLTEIYPKNSVYEIDNIVYQLEGYDMFCNPEVQGRGVAIYVKSSLNANYVSFETDFNESIWCIIQLDRSNTLLIGCIYRSPSSGPENTVLLSSMLRKVCADKYSHLLIMGDFNYREINWEENSTPMGENHILSLFLECIRDTYLFKHVREQTRFRDNNEPSTLDLILTNEENMIDNIEHGPGLGRSDHLTLSFNHTCFTSTNPNEANIKRNYFKGDYAAIRQCLEEIEWDTVLNGLDLSKSWSFFAEKSSRINRKKYTSEQSKGWKI